MHILVTAGPTREYIDTVRFLSNGSSGLTGYRVAAAAVERGHTVTLVSGPVSLEPPRKVRLIRTISTGEMYRACTEAFDSVDVVIMTAAVCDYRPVEMSNHKLKKDTKAMTLKLVRTPDILAELGYRKQSGQVLIGFALEDRRAKSSARSKMKNKNLDAIVLNAPTALGSRRNRVNVFYDQSWHQWPDLSKRMVAARIVRLAERLSLNVSRRTTD